MRNFLLRRAKIMVHFLSMLTSAIDEEASLFHIGHTSQIPASRSKSARAGLVSRCSK